MGAVKLSICIPTYNRAAFLRKLLSHIKSDLNFSFPFEIVVSDNASTDNTKDVAEEFIAQGMPIRYLCRSTNGGGWPNLTNAFLNARGEYAIYLADDDLLINEGIAAAMSYLDENSDVVACYAPWLLYDEIARRDTGDFYRVSKDVKFSQRQFADLFSFIFNGHVFPEIAIYRTSTLRSIYVPREFCFWAFSYLAHFVDQGAVAFLQRPFYRSVTRSTVERVGEQAGNEEVLTGWDRYRGGLEYFLYVAAKRGGIDLEGDQRAIYEAMCKVFTLNRMAVALRFWIIRKEYIKAYELYVRLVGGGLSEHGDVKLVKDGLPRMVALQTFARQINAAAGVRRLVLSNIADVNGVGGLLYELGLGKDVQVVGDSAGGANVGADDTIVFTVKEADREAFLARGHAPNLVFCEDDLTAQIIM